MNIALQHGVMIPWFKKEATSHKVEDLRKDGLVRLPLPADLSETALAHLATPREVTAGELLWDSPDTLPLYATVTGKVTGTETVALPGGEVPCLVIRSTGKGWLPPEDLPRRDPAQVDVIEAARQAAIIDELDGVPLWEKLRELKAAPCDILVADGVEPEPYACSAHGVLKLAGAQVLEGAALAAKATGCPRWLIAVQLKRKQHEALERRLKPEFVYGVKNRYPVSQYTPDKTASAARIGVQAALALRQAVLFGLPATTCVVTVTGDAVSHSRNLRIPYGTAFSTLFAHTGLEDDPLYAIAGDALTGETVPDDTVPVLPGVTCVLGLIDRIAPANHTCIGCGRCAKACHRRLLPFEIARRLENTHFDRLATLRPDLCDGCGVCGYVCPAGKDLTAQVLEAKNTSASIVMNWGDSNDL